VQIPSVPSHCEQPYHLFYLVLPSLEARQAFITYLNTREINTVFHYLPLHLSPMGRRFGGKCGDCPVTEQASDRWVRLPFYNDLTEADQMRVLAGIKGFRWKQVKS
jgi:dTDP-4-amino-4,6-dideoxygalactose transaminase